jgi:DNA polymerase III delta prime subunit
MEKLNINNILCREEKALVVKNILNSFDANKYDPLFKKGIYIYGEPGTGKTTFVINILKELNYDIIKYDAGDIRNSNVIEDITKHGMSNKNIISLFNQNVKKIAIIMDEIDGMNNGDKGGINTLIKIIRPKKTKKQKLEEFTINPIICIGNYHIDKKIKELMKVCNNVELNKPTIQQTNYIIQNILPSLDDIIKNKIIDYVQSDLRKINNIYKIYCKNPNILTANIIDNLFQIKSYNDNAKKIINKLIDNYYSIDKHNCIMNETDRTSVGLLWHENIIDFIEKPKNTIQNVINLYINQLDNICFADYIDRITFQKQIWQFNEMSSLIKTFKNNKQYHENYSDNLNNINKDIRFTKVLTKYSTEYNNSLFIQKLCQKLVMDKKDLFGFFNEIKSKHNDDDILAYFENYEIFKLDINRIYRYLEKYTKENAFGIKDSEIETVDEDDIVLENF